MARGIVSAAGWRLVWGALWVGVSAWLLDLVGWLPMPWPLFVAALVGALVVCRQGGVGPGTEGFTGDLLTAWLGLVCMAAAGPLLVISLFRAP